MLVLRNVCLILQKCIHYLQKRNVACNVFSTLPTQPEFTCSKLTIETLEQAMKYVQS